MTVPFNSQQGFPPPPGCVIDDKFVVSGLIGSGGTGVVVSARHRALARNVAIKFLLPELAASSDVVARFLREARATSQLKSEHVVGIIDVGTLPNGIPYFVMEHLTGLDLLTRLQERGPFSIDEVLDYVLQALEALAEAHRSGIVHRDFKPANLLLTTREDDSDFIKVLDFGTSKLTKSEVTISETITRAGVMLGSPLYMSPEQIRNSRDVDGRSDIWSVGVVMHELLTGHPPFGGNFLAEIITGICDDDYAPPAREDLPAELGGILVRCLQKEREDRFQSVEQLARAFLPIIRTVASQVSIERILRVPSSAPPPHYEDISYEGLALRSFGFADLEERHSSITPPVEEPRTSVAPAVEEPRVSAPVKVRSRPAPPIALGALGALGVLGTVGLATWLNLRSHSSVTLDGAASAFGTPTALSATVDAPTIPAKSAVSAGMLHPTGDAAAAHPARPRATWPHALASASASPAPVPEVSTTAPATSSNGSRHHTVKPEFRTLDGENPFSK